MVPESLGGLKSAKTSKYDQITCLYLLLKTLNQQISGGKKVYILAKDVDSKIN